MSVLLTQLVEDSPSWLVRHIRTHSVFRQVRCGLGGAYIGEAPRVEGARVAFTGPSGCGSTACALKWAASQGFQSGRAAIDDG